MKKFNLTEWSLKHKQLVYYFIAVMFLGGVMAYEKLGRMEDPNFTIRQMVVAVAWPGATARQVEEQVTDKIEKKLQDTPGLDYLKSYSMPGQSVIYVTLKEDLVTAEKVHPTWLKVRNMVSDVKSTLPYGVSEPQINDEFDDVFGCIYALTGDGFSYEELRERAESMRRTLLTVPSVKKVDLLGVQAEKVYIEIESAKLAQLGISSAAIGEAVRTQNAMNAAGMIEAESDNVYLRVSGMFQNLEDLKAVPLHANGRTIRLGDIAKIERKYVEPSTPKMIYNGEPAIGLAISMAPGGNILSLGKSLEKTTGQIKRELPVGLELHTVTSQPTAVKGAINEFIKTLAEAIGIVMIVSFVSLGFRSGAIVALCIPLVIAGVFIVMEIVGIELQKISLGALVISLGLLVDDAIIAIETMIVKLEQGWSRFDAACYTYTATAYPNLTGTLVTCAGFIPVGFSKGSSAEFVGSIFYVVTIALLISWVVAAVVTPLLGYKLIKAPAVEEGAAGHKLYDTEFYRKFITVISWCLKNRRKVLMATAGCFVAAILLLALVKQEFFPAATRPELIVDLQLPAGASSQAMEIEAGKFAARFAENEHVASYTYYVGGGAPRFVLTADPAIEKPNLAQFVFVAKDVEARVALEKEVRTCLDTEFVDVSGHTKIIQSGASDPYPVMLRVSGPDSEQVREIAGTARGILASDPNLRSLNLDWNEKSKVLRLDVDQAKARALGIENQALSASLQAMLSGEKVGEFREKDKTVSIVFRVDESSRKDLKRLKDLNIHIGGGRFVPLDQIAQIRYEAEDGMIWRRDLKPTITLQAETVEGVLGDDAAVAAYERLKELRDSLPPGYSIKVGGSVESSEKAIRWLAEPVPMMVFVIVTLLMFQLQNIPKMTITLLTAFLGLIGVTPALLLTGRPMGFVVQLGVLALTGIIIRNSVILIDQIERLLAAGEPLWDAIIKAAVTRFRPILLTAAAAILGMLPLVSSVFWGPMAVAISGGLFVATILTLIVMPVMYAAWYKAEPTVKDPSAKSS